jgi:hypothetical protein
MLILIDNFILLSLVLADILLFINLDRKDQEKKEVKKKKKERTIDKILNKFVPEERRTVMKQKLGNVYDLMTKTEKYVEEIVKRKIAAAKYHSQFNKKEVKIIKKGHMEYDTFLSGFKSARPRSEGERLQDLKDLQNAISMLESFDKEGYQVKPQVSDVGIGMFYDKMSQKIKSLIKNHNLNELDFIPIQKIKYYAFLNIKNIKDQDLLPIIEVMKETNLLSEIIEINPTFQIIVFRDGKKLEFSFPEKVVLSFAYDEDALTIKRLIELTEWKEDYAQKIIEGLKNKGILKIEEGNIIVENFGEIKERKKWNALIQDRLEEEKGKEEIKHKKQLERAAQLKKRLIEVEEMKIPDDIIIRTSYQEEPQKVEFGKKPSVKKLPTVAEEKDAISEPQDKDLKVKQVIKDKDDLITAMEALDKIEPSELEKSAFKKPMEEEVSSLEDLISEKILNYHEKFSLINGGFSQYEKIKQYILQKLKEVPEDLLITMLENLKELKMIFDSFKIGDYKFYVFKELYFNDDDKKFIEFAVNKKPMEKIDFINGLNWEEERVLKTMKELQEKGILRIEKSYIIIPGIVQEQ